MSAPRKYPDPELGTRFGNGTVTSLVHFKRRPGRKFWERGATLDCDCGTEYLADLASLYAGDRKSCGAQACRGRTGLLVVPDGYRPHPLRQTWSGMLHRCFSPVNTHYVHYGARGITVCDEWRGPEGFLRYVEYVEQVLGPKPGARYTLDRIDNDGNYEPGNLRWAAPVVQARNQRGPRENQAAIRAWAREHDLPVPDRGRLPAWLVAAYEAVH